MALVVLRLIGKIEDFINANTKVKKEPIPDCAVEKEKERKELAQKKLEIKQKQEARRRLEASCSKRG